MLYIGSSQGDPCIAKIHQNPHTGKYSTEIMTSFSNLGPIVDFCLFDYDQQGKVKEYEINNQQQGLIKVYLENNGLLLRCR